MRVTLVGFGVVARSFAEVVMSQGPRLAREHGLNPKIVGIVDSHGAAFDKDGVDLAKALESKKSQGTLAGLGDSYHEGMDGVHAIRETECEVVVETTPTELRKGEPGLSHVKTAMIKGRHVVCTNKGPLAIAMPALMELAHHNEVVFKFSGTVGGGTPVLDFAKKCLEGSEIRGIRGILNGTSNYILTRVAAEGVSVKDALADAQRLGYAEADPTYDVEGFDTACKLVITSNYVLGTALSINDVDIRGITKVTAEDMADASSKGATIKLIGSVGEKAKVSPEGVDLTHPLNVSGTFNAICFDTHPSGEVTLVGKGAGGPETATSVVRDLIEIGRSFAR
ncbi:MAG: homoserine dehydrogenase [Thermoplasmata archaeon]